MSPDREAAIKQIRKHMAPLRTDIESIRYVINPETYSVEACLNMLEAIENAAIEAIKESV